MSPYHGTGTSNQGAKRRSSRQPPGGSSGEVGLSQANHYHCRDSTSNISIDFAEESVGGGRKDELSRSPKCLLLDRNPEVSRSFSQIGALTPWQNGVYPKIAFGPTPRLQPLTSLTPDPTAKLDQTKPVFGKSPMFIPTTHASSRIYICDITSIATPSDIFDPNSVEQGPLQRSGRRPALVSTGHGRVLGNLRI